MNKLFTVLIFSLCAASVLCAVTKDKEEAEKWTKEQNEDKAKIGLMERFMQFLSLKEKEETNTVIPVSNNKTLEWVTNATKHKRQAYGGQGYGAPPQQGGYGGYGGPQQGGYPQPPLPQGPPPRNQILDGGVGADLPDFYDFYPNDFLYDYYNWVCSDTGCLLCNILTSECCNPNVNVNCFLPDSCLNNPCLSGGTCIPTVTPIDARPDFICVCNPGFTGKYCQLTNEFFFPPPPPPPQPMPYQPPQYNYQPPQPAPYQPQQPQYQQPAPYQAPPQQQYQAPPPQQQYQAPPPPPPAPYQPAPQPQPPQVRAPASPSYGGSNGQLGAVPRK